MTLNGSELQWDVSTVSVMFSQIYRFSIMTRGVVYLCPVLCATLWWFCSGKAGLPDPELLVERLLKRRAFRPDPKGSNLMFAFFAQHFTHQFFKTYNRMGLGYTKALAHGVSRFRGFLHLIVINFNWIALFITELQSAFQGKTKKKNCKNKKWNHET